MSNQAQAPKDAEKESLNLGYSVSSCHTVHLLDVKVQVYGLEEIKQSKKPIAALILTHGRGGNKEDVADIAHGILGEVKQKASAATKRDLLVVTLDQRNHGERLRDRTSNLSYDENPRHLYDMTASIVGGCQDVSYIIDFLAAYLFPAGDRTIDEWIASGVSLGGHVTYRLLLVEPRIRIAIPIIGLPSTSLPKLLKARALRMGFKWEPPIYPPSMRSVLEGPFPANAYEGKKILSTHGADDTLVPIKEGQEDIDKIVAAASKGEVEIYVQQGKGHEVSAQMVQKAAEWIWKCALQDEKKSAL